MTILRKLDSTITESPIDLSCASPTGVVQAPNVDRDVHSDGSGLDHLPTLTEHNYEPEILRLLAENKFNKDHESPLHLAAKQSLDLTRWVLHRDSDINIRNLHGETALMSAVDAGNEDIVAFLLENGADVVASGYDGTCLHLAASKDESRSMTQMLLRHNPDIEDVDGFGMTPLLLAAFNGNDAVVQLLLDSGAKPEAKTPDGYNALHYACMQASHPFMSGLLGIRGPDFEVFYRYPQYCLPASPSLAATFEKRARIVHSLIARGVDAHADVKKGLTPVHIAVLTAQEELVKILLAQGASVTGIPVITAYHGLSPQTVDDLLTRGADVLATDCVWKKTALHWTAEIGSPAMLKVLLRHSTTPNLILRHGSNVYHKDRQGSTPLHYAAANARNESIALLLEAGADPNMRDSWGNTPLVRLAQAGRFYLACKLWDPSAADRERAATQLLEAGCDASMKDENGNLAIHYAAENGYGGIIEAIVKSGGDLEALNRAGKKAVECAQKKGQQEVVKFLSMKMTMKRRSEGAEGGDTFLP
ncbi:hypothetical protein P7C71_g3298, partial [Lecanoromycetidae sp. Uapishka_2]